MPFSSCTVMSCLMMTKLLPPTYQPRQKPKDGRSVGHMEAPRGPLIHDYETDENGCIVRANMIVGTTHNMAP